MCNMHGNHHDGGCYLADLSIFLYQPTGLKCACNPLIRIGSCVKNDSMSCSDEKRCPVNRGLHQN